jgi:hypothetical protein
MKPLLIAARAVAIIAGINMLMQTQATAAGVNCSYEVCVKQCSQNSASSNNCANYCTKAMRDRKFAGQCK